MRVLSIHKYITLSVISIFTLSFLTILYVTNNKHSHYTQTPNFGANYENDRGDICPHLEVNDDDNYDDMCPICYEKISPKYCKLPCGHKFCKSCIDHWAQECKNGVKFDTDIFVDDHNIRIENISKPKKPECPLCRRPFIWNNWH